MLRSLELFGFKSFADRTRFDFPPGITGVVGPNGSGKSNVVDAVKWILGVQSAKSLRGKSMTDVIFNGAAGRKPSAMAEATLTFDNSSGFLKIDATEVQIGRRIMQGGDAEYFINRSPARLKDIVKLLLGTGAGGNAYCIIEQGRVDQILQANASARRKVFEEAAGISRYKTDKAEAERKLVRVEQNLLRLSDIVEEARSRLDSLRGQATKAARFRDVSERFREAWLGLAADDHRRLSAQLARFDEVLAERTEHITERTARQRELETELATMDGEVSEVDDRLRDAERRAAANREAISGRQVATRHETERAADLDVEIQRLRTQLALMNSRSREIAAEHARVQDQLRRFSQEHEHLADKRARREERIAALAVEVDHARTRLAEDRQRLLDRTRNASALGSRVDTCEAHAASKRSERDAARQRRAARDSEFAERDDEVERHRAAVAETEQTAAAAEDLLQGIRDRRAAVGGELNDAQRGLAEQREQRTAWQARLAVLEDLESRREGFGIGVREILSRAETSDYPPWNHIRGSVADLLEVDLEHAALIEVALGPRAQLIVLDRLQPLIEYLQSESCRISGRVGFVPYGSDEFRVTSDELSDRPGVIARADRWVRSPDELPELGKQLLADTWIVDTLATAVSLRAEVRSQRSEVRGQQSEVRDQRSESEDTPSPTLDPQPSTLDPRPSTLNQRLVRLVTLQGELLDHDGSLAAGTVRSEGALVSRKSELRRLKNDIARLERRIAEGERRLEEAENSLGRVDDELTDAKARVAEAHEARHAARGRLADAERDRDRLDAERTALAEELERIESGIAEADEAVDAARMELIREEEELRNFQEQLAQAERDLAQAEHRVRALEQQHAAEQLDLAKQEERLDGLREADDRLVEESRQRGQQRDEAARRLESSVERRSKARLRILATSAELAELFLAGERSDAETKRLSDEKRRVRSRRTALLEEEAAVRDDLRELHTQRHEAEMRARDRRHEIAALEQRIDEEFQVSLPEVVAEGASAYERAIQAHGQRPVGHDEKSDEASSSALNPQPSTLDPQPSTIDPPPTFEELRPQLEAEVERLRRQLKSMGSVNTDSLHDLDDLESRYDVLAAQFDDLKHAKVELEDIVRKINGECRKRFGETFTAIRGHFQELFRKLFGGGEGDIILEDPDDPLECGIDIVARPPGKELRSISLLSGGERTLTAVALLMAIFRSNPSPFCILDEVDAALDEANVDRFMNLLQDFRDTTQFIMITHRKPSMALCDALYGVTMEESGVSKRLSVRFEDVDENGEFRSGGPTSAAA